MLLADVFLGAILRGLQQLFRGVDASSEDGQEGDDHCAGEELEAHRL